MEIDLGTYKKTYLQISPQLPPDFNYSYVSNTEHKKMTQAEIKLTSHCMSMTLMLFVHCFFKLLFSVLVISPVQKKVPPSHTTRPSI